MLRRWRSVRERQAAFFVMALVGFTACGIFESESPEDDEDEDTGGSAGGANKPGRGGNSGNAGTSSGGISGAVPQGGDAGTNAGGTLGGTSPITGGTPSTGGSLPTGGTPAGGALPTGGTPSTGGASGTSAGGSGGGAPITCGTSWAVSDGGFVTAPGASGCWRGYAYTGTGAVGTTISPANFGTCGSPCMLCASGTVAADIAYAGIALLGFNVNQMSDSDISSTVTPTGTGLTVSFTNPGGSPLRIQIGGPLASTSETDRWCYNLSGSSGTVTIPYTGFSTTCWNTTGIAYAKQPLQTVQLLVPGDDVTAVPFSICLTGIADT